MAQSWYDVAGTVNDFTTFFDFGARYGQSAYRLIEGKSAKDMLDQIDEILRDAQQVLEHHKPILPKGQYPAFQVKLRRLHLNMVEEKKDYRATEDELIRNSRILSKIYGRRDTHHSRVADLLVKAESYHTDVVSASRNAQTLSEGQEDEDEPFPDVQPSTSQPAGPSAINSDGTQQQASDYCTTWMSVLNPPSRTCSSSELESGQSEPFPEPESNSHISGDTSNPPSSDRNFIAAITHIPQASLTRSDTDAAKDLTAGQNGYRRMILLEGMGKRVIIIDPKIHSIDEPDPYTSESSLRALSRAGEKLLTNNDTQSVESDAATSLEGPALNTILETFKKMKIGIV